ncbi:MAG: hypothetical protein ABWY45_00705 [Mycobacterium sp.]
MPELRRRGSVHAEYRPGTLREKLTNAGSGRVADDHPAAAHRR